MTRPHGLSIRPNTPDRLDGGRIDTAMARGVLRRP